MRTLPLKLHYKAIKILAVRWVGTRLLMHIFTETTTSDKKLGWGRRRSQYVQFYNFPNILLDGWEGLKAYTFEKRQSFKKFSTALRYAWRNYFRFFPPHFAQCSMASILQICFLRLCHTSISCILSSKNTAKSFLPCRHNQQPPDWQSGGCELTQWCKTHLHISIWVHWLCSL